MIILLIAGLFSVLILLIIIIKLFKYNKIRDIAAIKLFYDYINYKNYLINNITKYDLDINIDTLNNYSISNLEELFVNLKKGDNKMIYFVYGSLLENEYNHHVLGNSKKLYDGYITGFSMYSLGSFPTIIENDKNGIVYGEVYEVTDSDIERKLDFLEGYTGNKLENFYDKKIVQVTPINKDIMQCQLAFVYYFNSSDYYDLSNLIKIKNGNWKLRKEI